MSPRLRRQLTNATRARCDRRGGFTMAEMLVVMAIITILAASLAVVLPRIRTRSMIKGAKADIQMIANALEQYRQDIGTYPVAPFRGSGGHKADRVLYQALTNRNAGGYNRGWGGAHDRWDFIREESRTGKQILDPWGTPYYYIAHPDYLRGVRIDDPTDSTPADTANYFGTTPAPDDFRSASEHEFPPRTYYGPPPRRDAFYNANTFQLHSKGPDQKTDVEDDQPDVIDACDRGTDTDDINNFGD